MSILFFIVFSYEGRGITFTGLTRIDFLSISTNDSSGNWGRIMFPSFLFFIVNKAPECFYFTHLRLSSTCFRNHLGVTLLGYISHSKTICNANIYKLTEQFIELVVDVCFADLYIGQISVHKNQFSVMFHGEKRNKFP